VVVTVATFVLVHGAWHGAWCWERLIPELAQRGHDSLAVDLPIEYASATFEDYAAVVVDAAAHVTDDVVVVGHSLGAMTAVLVAAHRPTIALVLLCGITPNLDGHPWDGAPQAEQPGVMDPIARDDDGTSRWTDAEAATRAFFGTCTAEDAAWACAHLRPMNVNGLWASPYPLRAWPDTRIAAISCTDDAVVSPEFVRVTCTERLGVVPVEIPGDHSPFIRDPAGLADLLADLAVP
jgi:pimeloyl-ACP methyl ester carboxylesterase